MSVKPTIADMGFVSAANHSKTKYLFLLLACIVLGVPGANGRIEIYPDEFHSKGIEVLPFDEKRLLPNDPSLIQIKDGKPALNLDDFFELGIFQFEDEFKDDISGIRVELWIDPEDPPEGMFLLSYISSSDRGHIRRYFSFDSLPRGRWTTCTLWLSFAKKEPGFKIYARSRSPVQFEGLQKIAGNPGSVFIHSLERVYRKTHDQNPFDKAREKYSSYFDKEWSRWLLLSLCLILFLVIFVGARRKISLFFLACFLLPAISLLLFLGWFGHSTLENLQNARVYEFRRSLVQQFQRILKLQDSVEQRFQSELRGLQEEIVSYIQKGRESGQDFSVNDFDKEHTELLSKGNFDPHAPSSDAFDRFLANKLQQTGLEVLVSNGKAIFYAHRNKPAYSKGSYGKVLHNLLFRGYGPESMHKVSESFRNSQEAVLDMRKMFLVGDNLTDDFLNNPARLYQINISMSPFPWIEAREFWFLILEAQTQFPWFGLGYIQSDTLTRFLQDEYEKSSLLDYLDIHSKAPLEYFVSGFSSQRSFPSALENRGLFSLVSQEARVSQKLIFKPSFEKGRLYFYLSGPIEKQPQISLTLRVCADEIYQKLQERLNTLYLGACILFGILLGICLPLSISVTRPILSISKGLQRVRSGDLSLDLPVKGYDQFANAANHFNSLIEQLREKERLSKFLSQIALRSLKSGERKTTRQLVGILFCGIRNLEDYSSQTYQMRLDTVRKFLDLLSESLESSPGSMDKFTGQAAIILFSGENPAPEMLELALSLKEKFSSLGDSSTKGNQSALQIGIGIAAGYAVLGSVGPEMRKDYTAIGSTVNLAARLHSLGDSCQGVSIHLNEEAKEMLGDTEYALKEHRSVEIKGFQEKQRVYEVS